MFWVSPDGLEIVVQSESSRETHYFNNDISRKCYTFKVPGKWQPSSQSISLLENRESEQSHRVTLGSSDQITTWRGSNAGVYIYSPLELAGPKGPDLIFKAVAMATYSMEQQLDTTPTTEKLLPFECSWPEAKIWTAKWSILLNGEITQISDEKIFIDIGEGCVAQITLGKSSTPRTKEGYQNFIKTFNTKNVNLQLFLNSKDCQETYFGWGSR